MKRFGLTIAMGLSVGLLVAVGLPMTAVSGPTVGGGDTDLDGVDDNFDNCVDVANADQADTNHDGCGDVCSTCAELQCDVDQSGTTNITDFGALSACFGAPASCNPGADCNGDGNINISDFGLLSAEFGVTCIHGVSGLLAQLKSYPCDL